MTPRVRISISALALVALAGCSDMSRWQQRALSGAAIGAAAGAGVGYLAGGPVVGAALLGGAAGAAIGGLTTPDDVSIGHRR